MVDFEPTYLLSLSDEDLGIHLWAWWIGYQAEKKGVANPGRDFVESLRIGTLKADTKKLSRIPIEKSLKCVAENNPAGAGEIFRQVLLDSNIKKSHSPLVRKAAEHMLVQSKKAKLPRTKPLDNGETIDCVIKRLWKEHPNYKAKELWSIFTGEMTNICGVDARVLDGRWLDYVDNEGKDRTIAFGTFSNKLTTMKNKNNS
jgi:hypothetical protein